MIEHVMQHPAGRFTRCRACGHEPRHVVTRGTSSREPIAFSVIDPRHSLECRCGARTARHTTLDAAEREWGTDYAQLALPLRRTRRQPRRAIA